MILAYSTPIIAAVIVLLLIGFFTAIPWLIHSYRKYGFLSFWNTFVIVSFIFYALSAYFLVILPLPEVRDTCAMQGSNVLYFQPIPFYFLYEMITDSPIIWSKLTSYIHLIKHPSFLPAFLNVLILFPLGVYMRYFRGETLTVKRMFLIGFFVSLFFEITQITGLYGIYNCPYRTFNVDDLILNTFGAICGFIVAPAILVLFPTKDTIQKKSKQVFKEGFVRPIPQLLALLVDYLIVLFSWILFSSVLSIDHGFIKFFWIVLGMFLIQYLVPLYAQGQTPGTKILRFYLVKEFEGDQLSRALFKRWLAIIAPLVTYQFLNSVVKHSTLDMNSPYYAFQIFLELGLSLLSFIIVVVLVVHALTVLLSRKRKRFYFDEFAKVVNVYDQIKNNE